jgi:hypothetical protein
MIRNCEDVQRVIQGFSLVNGCDPVRDGALRLSTPFTYPEGASIDLFLTRDPQSLFDYHMLTDMGQTTSWLLDMHVKPWTTKRRIAAVESICDALRIEQFGGELRTRLADEGFQDLPSAVVRLGQACVRVADLVLTQRLRLASAFFDDFEEYVSGLDRPYEVGVSLPSRHGTEVQVDMRVHGRSTTTLVQTLSTGHRSSAHNMANEAFSRWYDLGPARDEVFLTAWDESNDVFKLEDLDRLADLSIVFPFPSQARGISEVLSA